MKFTPSTQLKNIFWNGIKLFVPMVLTFAIAIWIFGSLETFFGGFLRYFIPEKYYFPGLGILIGIATIFAAGILVNAWIVRKIYRFAEKIVKRIPLIKTIYNGIQDLFSFFDKNQTAKQTVLVKTPLGKIIGFVTRTSFKEMPTLGAESEIMVYIPLSYTIGGLTMILPKKDIEILDWPVDKAMSFAIMAGMIKIDRTPDTPVIKTKGI